MINCHNSLRLRNQFKAGWSNIRSLEIQAHPSPGVEAAGDVEGWTGACGKGRRKREVCTIQLVRPAAPALPAATEDAASPRGWSRNVGVCGCLADGYHSSTTNSGARPRR